MTDVTPADIETAANIIIDAMPSEVDPTLFGGAVGAAAMALTGGDRIAAMAALVRAMWLVTNAPYDEAATTTEAPEARVQ
ncbi:hypothetical protein ORIO_12430 [Cereibacter azotoformans]|uniref:hypothetical protein n=1 Tax=Cereibacter azotoformans TaxID=43057 RepID=UPI000E359D3B|nr:hypothetical protein [Cereibacter azotoformans]AXQ93177.1 hypothetical protein D0Z66_04735 [Cereibacter sphaeroides]UIJ31488.1 hypothetical protein LV780_04745 [Cereibacter azotoformans]ULB10710.1 hypothetical protein ORIO_12430 [Cereibacter azotoformans]